MKVDNHKMEGQGSPHPTAKPLTNCKRCAHPHRMPPPAAAHASLRFRMCAHPKDEPPPTAPAGIAVMDGLCPDMRVPMQLEQACNFLSQSPSGLWKHILSIGSGVRSHVRKALALLCVLFV